MWNVCLAFGLVVVIVELLKIGMWNLYGGREPYLKILYEKKIALTIANAMVMQNLRFCGTGLSDL
jgi:hypothetical protein